MSFIAVLLALLIEQARPLARYNLVHSSLRRWARQCALHLDTGRPAHGVLAWSAAVGVPALAVAAIYHLLWAWPGWIGAAAWSVAVLYATLGFRQFSHHFTAIRDALDAGDEARARTELAQWQQVQVAHLPRSELVRHVIETSVLAAHRHVFGVLLCYGVGAALGLGPAGAVLYRMAEYVPRGWGATHRLDTRASRRADGGTSVPGADAAVSPRPLEAGGEDFDSVRAPLDWPGGVATDSLTGIAQQAWWWVDWLPARATALSFAVVGSFEEAIDRWRAHSERMGHGDNDAVILAATAGAMDVRLGGAPLHGAGAQPAAVAQAASDGSAAEGPGTDAPRATPGREAEPAHLRSVVGLVWRSVVLWLLLIALLTLARLTG